MSIPNTPEPQGNYQKDLFDETHQQTEHNSRWGDALSHKVDRTLRIYFQNINGLPHNDHWAEWNHIISYLKKHRVDIGGFAEPNIKWTKQLTAAAKHQVLAHVKPSTL